MRHAVTALLLLVLASDVSAQIGLRTGRARGGQTAATAQTITMNTNAEGDTGTCTTGVGYWPTRNNPNYTLCLFNHDESEQEYLKYARFFSTSKTTSATTDLVNDAFGGVYVAFSVAVAATTDTDDTTITTTTTDDATASEDKALNLLKSNGGNVAITASYPIYYRPFTGTGDANTDNDHGGLLWNSYVRFAGNVDAMGGDTNEETIDDDDLIANVEIAFSELQVDLMSFQRKFNLLGYARTSAILGTGKFASALGDNVSRTFLHGQVGAGLRVADNVSLYFTYNWYSDDDVPGNGATFTIILGD